MVAHAINGRYGDPSACLRTIVQYWKNTTAGLDLEGQPVDSKIIASTKFQFIIVQNCDFVIEQRAHGGADVSIETKRWT